MLTISLLCLYIMQGTIVRWVGVGLPRRTISAFAFSFIDKGASNWRPRVTRTGQQIHGKNWLHWCDMHANLTTFMCGGWSNQALFLNNWALGGISKQLYEPEEDKPVLQSGIRTVLKCIRIFAAPQIRLNAIEKDLYDSFSHKGCPQLKVSRPRKTHFSRFRTE